jgi:hypothetical protein
MEKIKKQKALNFMKKFQDNKVRMACLAKLKLNINFNYTITKNLFFLIVISTVLSSCVTTHTGQISTSNFESDVQYCDIAYGVAKSNIVLGIGAFAQEVLVLDAKNNLMQNRPLLKGEQYANFSVSIRRISYPNSVIILYQQIKVMVSADVVRFNTDNGNAFTDNYKNKLGKPPLQNPLFDAGDSVLFFHGQNIKTAQIVSVISQNDVKIVYHNNKFRLKSKKIPIMNIYSSQKSSGGYKIGSEYSYKNAVGEVNTGKIVAVGLVSIILSKENGELFKVNIK